MTDQSVTTHKRRRPADRPAEILQAALDLFTERGFSATRLEDVASRAGLSKAAIYLYFRDKASLLETLVQDMMGGNIALASALVAQHQGPVEPLLRQIVDVLAGRITETRLPYLIKLVISESRAHPEIGKWYLETIVNKALPMFRSVIERGIANGEFRAVDAEMTVKSFVAPMLLAAMWKSVFEPLGAAAMDIPAFARNHADIMLRGLKP